MHLRAVDYSGVANRFKKHLVNIRRTHVAMRECSLKLSSALEPKVNKRNRGDAVAEDLLESLDMFGVTRTPGQKTFHREFFKACLPHIYGSDIFENDRERILRKFGFTDIRYEVLVVCPRRWGKTYSVALFIAAMAWTVPDMWISIFSTGQRASTSLLELVSKFLATIGNGTENRILSKNSERVRIFLCTVRSLRSRADVSQLYVRGLNASDIRKVYSYPSSVQVRILSPISCVVGWDGGMAGWLSVETNKRCVSLHIFLL